MFQMLNNFQPIKKHFILDFLFGDRFSLDSLEHLMYVQYFKQVQTSSTSNQLQHIKYRLHVNVSIISPQYRTEGVILHNDCMEYNSAVLQIYFHLLFHFNGEIFYVWPSAKKWQFQLALGKDVAD